MLNLEGDSAAGKSSNSPGLPAMQNAVGREDTPWILLLENNSYGENVRTLSPSTVITTAYWPRSSCSSPASYFAPAALSPATVLRITDVSSLKWLACHSQMPGDRRQLWFYGFTRCLLGANPRWEGALHGLPSSSVSLQAHWGHTVNIFSVRLDGMRQGWEEAALTRCKLRC
ncbi:hypothetical protein MHYP_G00334270 [Metynnis hypsauchen]